MRRCEWLLFALVFFTHAYFFNATGWNQNARLDSIFAFVEPGTSDYLSFRINSFLPAPQKFQNTGDWSFHEGNYYSNKAPGTLLLGIPLYFILYRVEKLIGVDPTTFSPAYLNAYLLNLWISVFWTALAAVLLFRFAQKYWQRSDALWIALVYSMATLVFPFDSQLWGHTTAAAFLIAMLYFLFEEGRMKLILSGFFAGLAVLTEYHSALVIPFVIWMRFFKKQENRKKLGHFIIGGMGPACTLMIYHKICFGSFFTFALAHMNPLMTEPDRLGGVLGAFSLQDFAELLFSLNRGIFVFMPVLALSIGGAIKQRKNPLTTICLGMMLGTLVLLSCFNGKGGGHSSGPRYLIISLPFWCLCLPAIGQTFVLRKIAIGLSLLSALNMLVINSVSSLAPPNIYNPLYGHLYPAFLRGEFGWFDTPIRLFRNLSQEQLVSAVFNWGNRIFMFEGMSSLIPLGVFEVICLAALYKTFQEST